MQFCVLKALRRWKEKAFRSVQYHVNSKEYLDHYYFYTAISSHPLPLSIASHPLPTLHSHSAIAARPLPHPLLDVILYHHQVESGSWNIPVPSISVILLPIIGNAAEHECNHVFHEGQACDHPQDIS
ncbi:hypothetical protein MKW98_021015 [Papaver atlanticum]|uniref:Uncharacterized protein n=1 Tax=Papaver atlanticum TaxID=357466 RepID=A0AAD4XHA9_9MAGN|nr:hypothetical protein MKW98_021015 [Papaver atlanticum]